MIARALASKIKSLQRQFPVLYLTGPRQSGKTTLLKNLFPKLPYVSLEDPDVLHLALHDARAFLNAYKGGVIIDEAQRAPEIFSYIQTIVDGDKKRKFILSGSQNFLLHKHISQSLAGRTAVLTLLPLSIQELKTAKAKQVGWEATTIKGFYPRLFNSKIAANDFYASYLNTYVERDVRLTLNISDLKSFNTFLKICAGRVGQMINHTQMSNDIGISPNTVKGWLSVLESSYLTFQLQPYFNNFNKRLVKSPKLYFFDTGLLCYLLGIKKAEEIFTHPFKGAIFENLIIAELYKSYTNSGTAQNLYYWRDKTGHEVDCIILKSHNKIEAIEIKAGSTFNKDFFDNLNYFAEIGKLKTNNKHLIYNGKMNSESSSGLIHSYSEIENLLKLTK
jgi:predicted AAA+ superfamily ATPase